jgi:hypothetical protein
VYRAHRVIRAFVRAAASMAGEDPAALVALLSHTLPAHFAIEERGGGFFDQLLAKGVPEPVLTRLRDEHVEFRESLRALEAEVASGADPAPRLQALSERLRAHERLESACAVKRGLRSPTDAGDPSTPALPAELRARLDALAHQALELACRDDALLAGVTVGTPDGTPRDTLREAVEAALAEYGLDFVDVEVEEAPRVELRSWRFEPGPNPAG